MSQRYTSLEDLWSEWGSATSAIMKHIEKNEPIDSKYGWDFNEAWVVNHHHDGYTVTIIHTAYDPSVSNQVLLSVQAKVTESDEINVSTVKRSEIETS